jgi:hypothetical protein
LSFFEQKSGAFEQKPPTVIGNFGFSILKSDIQDLARSLLEPKPNQPGRRIEFMNLGEGMNSGNRPGCFFIHIKLHDDTPTAPQRG